MTDERPVTQGTVPTPPFHAWRRVLLAVLLILGWYGLYRVLAPLSGWLTFTVLGFSEKSALGLAVQFFIYDTPKVLLLLILVVFVVGIIRSFFSVARTRALLAGRRTATGTALAALLGVVTPFCSCSAVPLFIGFVTTGVPLGVTFSFLIAAPMVNEVALVLLYALFGWKIAALYLGMGLCIAMLTGSIIGRLRFERYVEPWVYAINAEEGATADTAQDWSWRLRFATDTVREILGKVWPYVMLGIAVGAAIHGYAAPALMAGIMGTGAWWSVPLAVLIGIPMYSNAAGIIPVVQALIGKGAALGTVLAFMMSVIGLSLPEIIMLRKVLRPQLIGAFIAVVGIGILLVGFLFNMVPLSTLISGSGSLETRLLNGCDCLPK